jgi:hypothetical protein
MSSFSAEGIDRFRAPKAQRIRAIDVVLIASLFFYQYFSKGAFPPIYGHVLAALTLYLGILKCVVQLRDIPQASPFAAANIQRTAFLFTVFMLFGMMFYSRLGRFDMLFMALLCYAMWDIGLQRFTLFASVISSLYYGCHLVLFRIGVIQDHTDAMARLTNDGLIYRSAIGFDHPNYSICFILPIICGAILLKNKFGKIAFGMIALVYSIVSYQLTDSRTAFFVCIAGLLLSCVSFFHIPDRLLFLFSLIFIPMGIAGTYWIASTFSSNARINFLLSQRPRLWHEILPRSFRIFGAPEARVSYEAGGSVDNFFLNLQYSYGLVITVIVIILIVNLLVVAKRYGNANLMLVVDLYLFYGLAENHVLDYGYSFIGPLIFMAILWPCFFELDEDRVGRVHTKYRCH